MKKLILLGVVSTLFLSSCASNKQSDNLKKVTYTSNFQTSSLSDPFEKRRFTLLIPKGYELIDEDYNPEFKEVIYKYKNGSIYITDNSITGSELNGDNKLASGIIVTQRTSLQDSLYMKGQNNGLYWKENILNDIVVGYLDVPKELEPEFDKAIASIARE